MNALRRFGEAIRRWRWTEFQLLIVPAILGIIGMLIVIVVPTGNLTFTWRDLWMGLLFIGLLLGTHLFLGATQRGADQLLLPIVAVITALGMIMIWRLQLSLVNAFGSDYEGIAGKQMLW